MTFRITVLCENSVGPLSGTLGEHGFSALIEPAHGEPILFDTGQGATLLHNARRMNKDLSRVSRVAISHGHYDHTGGLLPLLRECGPKTVYAHPGIFNPRYRVKDTGDGIAIGLPHDRATLETAGAAFDLSAEFRELAPKVYLSGQVPRVTAFETGDRGLFSDCTGTVPDPTPDDQSLVLETARGLVILLGCCHAGLVNTLEHVAGRTGRRDLYAVVGGTHLGFSGREQLERTIAYLRQAGVTKVAACHCTGFSASALMARELPKGFQVAAVGYTLEV
jgi:7,8-dihydropterin-6-yl-methyl-4-(beta-D-ribofuranosyl)aminobenzene 5'-phosphate synthase